MYKHFKNLFMVFKVDRLQIILVAKNIYLRVATVHVFPATLNL